MSDDDYAYNVFDAINDRWPRRGDQVFVPSRHLHLATNTDERLHRLIKGYKRAGDVLIQRMVDDPAENRNLVYPAIFCYRHYVELALKEVIKEHGPSLDVHLKKLDHKLDHLWRCVCELISADGNGSPDDLEVVGTLIGELNAVDPGSVTFRFATDTKDAPIPQTLQSVDLLRLHDVMNGIENFLECVDLHLTAEKDASPF